MTGDYVDPILSRSPYSSPARGGSLDQHRNSGTFENRFAGHDSPSKDREVHGGPSSPRANFTSRTSIESPIGIYRSSRLQELEDDNQDSTEGDMDLDSRETGTPARGINAAQQAEAPEFDEDVPRRAAPPIVSPVKPRPLASTTTPTSFRGSPLKHSVPSEAPGSPSTSTARPLSPTSSIGTSATSSTGPSAENVGVGYKSNLGLLQSSGPDQCRRCGKAVYFAEQVMAGGHK